MLFRALIQPQRQELSWSPPTGPVLSSESMHTMRRRQDNIVQSDLETWSSTPSQSGLYIANGISGLPLGPTSDTVGTDRSKLLPVASPIECSLPPSPLGGVTGGISRTHTVLQGTISALKPIQQISGLALVPGLPNLVGVVLNISEVVNVSFDAT